MSWEVVQIVLANIFQVAEGALVMLATGVAGILLHKLAVKFHLGNEVELKAGLDYALEKGVRSAESWANGKSTAVTGGEKMDMALGVTRLFLTNPTFKGMADTQLKKLVEAALHTHINGEDAAPATLDVNAIAAQVAAVLSAPK